MTDAKIKKIIDEIIILMDTREQDKYIKDTFEKYNVKYERVTFKSGDFSAYIPPIPELNFEGMDFRNELLVERKNSLSEISQNLTKHKKRFENEFNRTEAQILIVIEDSYKNGVYGKYDSDLPPKSMLGLLHSWEYKYDTKVIFIDKEVAPLYIYNVFKYYLRHKLKALKTD